MSTTHINGTGAHHTGGLPAPTSDGSRLEGVVQVLILLTVGGMAAAASFRHVHDWTMRNSPAGTGDWFGWANAVISDLVPLGVGLEVRRRRRMGLPIGAYPIVIIVAAASLSLAGQLAEAKPSPSGWLLAAVPALGFLALTKLILSRPTTPAPAPDETRTTATVPAPQPSTADTGLPIPAESRPEVPTALLPHARLLVTSHRQATGQPITPDVLAERLRVPVTTADGILAALGEHTTAITTPHNGTPVAGSLL